MSHERFYLLRCCPSCRSLDVRRSHRRGLFEVLILPFFLLRPFRCEDCTKRHYNFFFTRALHEPEESSRRPSGQVRDPFAETGHGDEAKF
jgi:hypothetical protein